MIATQSKDGEWREHGFVWCGIVCGNGIVLMVLVGVGLAFVALFFVE